MRCLICVNSQDGARAKGISFHRFPLNPEQRKKWLLELGFPHFDPSHIDVLCSEHFADDAFKKTSKNNCRLLKRDALPNVRSSKKTAQMVQQQQDNSILNKRLEASMQLKIVDVCSLSQNGITPSQSAGTESDPSEKRSVSSDNLLMSTVKRKTEPSNVSVVLASDNSAPVYFHIKELEGEKQSPSYDSISLISSSSEDECDPDTAEDYPDLSEYPILNQQMLEQTLSPDNSWLNPNESATEEQNSSNETNMNIALKKWRGLQAMLESDEKNDTTEELIAKIACLKDVCIKRNKMIKNLHQIIRRKDDKMSRLETILYSFKGHVNYSKLKSQLSSQSKTTLNQIWDGKPLVIQRRKYKRSQVRRTR